MPDPRAVNEFEKGWAHRIIHSVWFVFTIDVIKLDIGAQSNVCMAHHCLSGKWAARSRGDSDI